MITDPAHTHCILKRTFWRLRVSSWWVQAIAGGHCDKKQQWRDLDWQLGGSDQCWSSSYGQPRSWEPEAKPLCAVQRSVGISRHLIFGCWAAKHCSAVCVLSAAEQEGLSELLHWIELPAATANRLDWNSQHWPEEGWNTRRSWVEPVSKVLLHYMLIIVRSAVERKK